MSFAEDEGYDAWDLTDFPNDNECYWITKEGKTIYYEDLETKHIKNIIKKFKYTEDSMPNLFKELKKRLSELKSRGNYSDTN